MATATWNIPWIESKKFSIGFKTDVDSEYTAHEQRNKLQSLPRYGWSIRMEKTLANYRLLRAFFEARSGKYNAFNWKWDSLIDPMGDNITYLVRFDVDEFDFEDDGGLWVIPIVQVMSSE